MLGMHGTFEANKTMHNADLIFAVGARFDDRVTNNVAKFCPNATIVHIDIDPTSISKTVQAHVPIVGSVETVLEQMLEVIRECGFDNDKQVLADWWSQIGQWRSRNCLAYETHPTLIKPQQVIETLYKVTKGRRSWPPTWVSTRCCRPSTTRLPSRASGSTQGASAPWGSVFRPPWAPSLPTRMRWSAA